MSTSPVNPTTGLSDIRAFDLYMRLLRRWPWLLLIAIVGGVLGMVWNAITPPVYRAVGVLDIGIDYGRVRFLDEDAEQHIYLRIQELLLSDAVLAGALERLGDAAGSDSEDANLDELRQRLRLIHYEGRWELAADDKDPQRAADIANAWAESGLSLLAQAQAHAWKAAELQAMFFRVWCRPEVVPGVESEGLWICDEANAPSGQPELPEAMLEEVQLSRGIVPAISSAWSQRAEAPSESQTIDQVWKILAGALLGFGTAVIVSLALPPASMGQRRRDP